MPDLLDGGNDPPANRDEPLERDLSVLNMFTSHENASAKLVCARVRERGRCEAVPPLFERLFSLSWQLAELFEKQGNIPATEKTLLESVESVAESIHENTAWTHICRFYERHGSLETRKEDWEKILAKEPGNRTARRALAATSALGRR